ncbi:MAG TPA: class I SAM-dependent methyltransferase [Gammaproteobacteria bacterium]|nr:class I SAM-dependent methyltransferase [Gammaproteobacteria bacterium]
MEREREEERIRRIYSARDQNLSMGFGMIHRIIDSFYRDRALYNLLKKYDLLPLADKKIIDFGCGTCARLRELIRFGATPENLYGIDLSKERIAICQKFSPNINVQVGSCIATGYPDDTFDIVINSTMMSSILDNTIAQDIADEMCRVLKPSSGVILWYDMRFDNPWNKDVRGYSREAIQHLFSGYSIDLRSISLPSRFGSIVESVPSLYHLMHIFPFLRTHYFGVIKKCQ